MKLNLECSPSLTTSMPSASCRRTTSDTESLIPRASAARSCSRPASLAYSKGAIPGGRGRLPTWVVRIRSSLRFTVLSFRLPRLDPRDARVLGPDRHVRFHERGERLARQVIWLGPD